MDVKREGSGSLRRRACLPLIAAAMWLAWVAGPAPASAGELYKCGKNFQDRPCEGKDVQQRFSRAKGTFATEQVNPAEADLRRSEANARRAEAEAQRVNAANRRAVAPQRLP
jgi:hypothetical protein